METRIHVIKLYDKIKKDIDKHNKIFLKTESECSYNQAREDILKELEKIILNKDPF